MVDAPSRTPVMLPVGQVTLDAGFVADTIATLWAEADRIVQFNEKTETRSSRLLDAIGEDLYRAAGFPIEHDESGSVAGLGNNWSRWAAKGG